MWFAVGAKPVFRVVFEGSCICQMALVAASFAIVDRPAHSSATAGELIGNSLLTPLIHVLASETILTISGQLSGFGGAT